MLKGEFVMGHRMSAPAPAPDPAPATASGRRRLRIVLCTVLIAAPVALGLAVPLYQRQGPALAGIPFFYWFQMSMAVLAALGTGSVYRLLFAGADDAYGQAPS